MKNSAYRNKPTRLEFSSTPPLHLFPRPGFSEEVMTSSARCFLLVLVGFLGSRQTFSSTRARFSLLPVLALLLSALGLFVAAPAQATTPVVNLWASPGLVLEGSDVTITARLTSALESQVTIPLTLTDNSAESTDHGTLANITINPGSTSGTGTISTNQDTDEDNETFTVALDTANLPSSVTAGGRSSVRITIMDDDPFPTVSLSASPNPVLLGETVVVRVTLSFALSEGRDDPGELYFRARVSGQESTYFYD